MDRPSHDNVFLWSPEGRTRFVELVALQSVLSKIPIELEHRQAHRDTATTNSSWRLLPPKVEKEVADYFAFLTAADAGSEFVSAACVEERPGGGVVFRLAMNEAVPRRILEEVRGFCEVLQRVANKEKTEHAGRIDMWERVTDAEERKVVRNLKQKFARGSSQLPELFRQALGRSRGDRGTSELNFYASSTAGASGDSLPSGVTSMTGTSQLKDAGTILETIYAQCQDVVRGDVNGGRVGEEVRRLLDTCYQARKSKSFKAYLTKIKCPKALMQTIEKLGRYKAASYHLVSMAKKYPSVFNVIEVHAVEPPLRGALPPPTSIDHGLAQLASELTGSSTQDAKEKIMNLTGISERMLEISFEDIYLTRPHVHAEMQMVKFYEENSSINPPHFIGLSKKSCYLCNLFLHFHGQFNVSKCHPSIYLKWSLPPIGCKSSKAMRNYTEIMEQMTRVLEDNCLRALNFDPNELQEKTSRRKKSTASIASSIRSVEWAPSSRPRSLADLSTAVRLAGERLGMSVQDMQSGIVSPRRQSVNRKQSHDRSRRQSMDQSRPVTSNGTASRASTKKDQDWPSRTSSPKDAAVPSVVSSRTQTPRPIAPPHPKFQRLPTHDEVAGGVPLNYESSRATPVQYNRSDISGAQYPLPPSEVATSVGGYPIPRSELSGVQYSIPRSEVAASATGYPNPRSEVSGVQYSIPRSEVTASATGYPLQSSEISGAQYPLPASEVSGYQHPPPLSEVSGYQHPPPLSEVSGHQYPLPSAVSSYHQSQYLEPIQDQHPFPASEVSGHQYPLPSSVSSYNPSQYSRSAQDQYHQAASSQNQLHYPSQYPGPPSQVSQYPGPTSVLHYPGPPSSVSQYPGPNSSVSQYPGPPSSVSQYPAPPPQNYSTPPSKQPPSSPKVPLMSGASFDPLHQTSSPVSSSRLAPPSKSGQKTRFTSVEALTGATTNLDTSSTVSRAATNSRSRLDMSETAPLSAVGSRPSTSAVPPPISELEEPPMSPLRIDKGKGRELNVQTQQKSRADPRELLSPLESTKPRRTRTKSSSNNRGPLNLTIERKVISRSHLDTQYTIYLVETHSAELPAGKTLFHGTINKPTQEAKVIQCKGFNLRVSLRDISKAPPTRTGSEAPLRVRQISKSKERMVMDISFSDATVRLEVFWDD